MRQPLRPSLSPAADSPEKSLNSKQYAQFYSGPHLYHSYLMQPLQFLCVCKRSRSAARSRLLVCRSAPVARRSPAARPPGARARDRSSAARPPLGARAARPPLVRARSRAVRGPAARAAHAARPCRSPAARGSYSRSSSAARSLDHLLLYPSLRLCHSLPCFALPGVGFCRNLVSCCSYGKAAEGFCGHMTDGKIYSCCNRLDTEVKCITPAVCGPARSK